MTSHENSPLTPEQICHLLIALATAPDGAIPDAELEALVGLLRMLLASVS